MTDLRIFGDDFTDVAGIKAQDSDGNEYIYEIGGVSANDIANATLIPTT